jgi:hypothetical protein
MNITQLNTITNEPSSGWGTQAVENRLRAIAMNAVREARVALERDVGPWLDDDSRRQNMIYELLHLSMSVVPEHEALPVAPVDQAVRNEALDSIEKALLKLPDSEEVTSITPSKPKATATKA